MYPSPDSLSVKEVAEAEQIKKTLSYLLSFAE
jgi:hypothetical protein